MNRDQLVVYQDLLKIRLTKASFNGERKFMRLKTRTRKNFRNRGIFMK